MPSAPQLAGCYGGQRGRLELDGHETVFRPKRTEFAYRWLSEWRAWCSRVLAGSPLQDRAALLNDLVLVGINASAEDARQLLELLCTDIHSIIRVTLLCT